MTPTRSGYYFDNTTDQRIDPPTPKATRHAAAVLIAQGLDTTCGPVIPTMAADIARMLGLLPTTTRQPRRAHHRTSER